VSNYFGCKKPIAVCLNAASLFKHSKFNQRCPYYFQNERRENYKSIKNHQESRLQGITWPPNLTSPDLMLHGSSLDN
jgi:hypothetical protein